MQVGSVVSEIKSPIRYFKSTIAHSFCHKKNAVREYTSCHATLRTQIKKVMLMRAMETNTFREIENKHV